MLKAWEQNMSVIRASGGFGSFVTMGFRDRKLSRTLRQR